MKNPKLVISRKDAKSKLEERIELGYQFLSIKLLTENKLNEVRREYNKWHEYNSALLNSMFHESSVAEAYSFPPVYSTLDISFDEQVNDFRDEVRSSLDFLDRIIENLELYEIYTPDTSDQKKIGKKKTKVHNPYKVAIISGLIVIIIAIFVFEPLRDLFIKTDASSDYFSKSLQYQPRLVKIGDPYFTKIDTEPFKLSNIEILKRFFSHTKGDTLDLGFKIIIKRIYSRLNITNTGNSLAKIIACISTSKRTYIDILRSIILGENTEYNIKDHINIFPPLFQNEILSSSLDTVSVDFTHEIYSNDLLKKSGILHFMILYENEMGHLYDTYFWLEISLSQMVIPNPFYSQDSLLLMKNTFYTIPIENIIVKKMSKPSYHTYTKIEEQNIRSYIGNLFDNMKRIIKNLTK